jgi:hypothetical protein
MSRQVSSILEPLADAVDNLDLPVDPTVLIEAFAVADRLNAKLLAAVGEHDTTEVWRNDGATSMPRGCATTPASPDAKPPAAPGPPAGCVSSP